jgi:hypothetical protein
MQRGIIALLEQFRESKFKLEVQCFRFLEVLLLCYPLISRLPTFKPNCSSEPRILNVEETDHLLWKYFSMSTFGKLSGNGVKVALMGPTARTEFHVTKSSL